ncbi:hypothetical protein TNCV_606721 [Trichonephila clavipes]|nr:hypothetical protein TNCV_606721 [Trichonephila clavipes]
MRKLRVGHACEPETPCVIRGVRKKPTPSQDHGVERVENVEENGCVASSLTSNVTPQKNSLKAAICSPLFWQTILFHACSSEDK